MQGRLATDADAAALAEFFCTRMGEEYETEVEEWINNDALDWSKDPIDARLLVFHDEDGDLVAVGAHRQADGGHPERGRYIQAVAVLSSAGGDGLGPAVLYEVLHDALECCPGGTAIWLVHPLNTPSRRMCEKIGADSDIKYPPDRKPYMEYSLDLDAAAFLDWGDA